MSILLQDSGRNLKLRWALDDIEDQFVDGMVLSPFETPLDNEERRRGARECVEAIQEAGGIALLDPSTHAACLSTTNKWTQYDTWDLWRGARGDLSDENLLQEHVRRVMARQRDLNLSPIAPTIALESVFHSDVEIAYNLAERSIELDASAIVAVAGTPSFWAQGEDLDDWIGRLAVLQPRGWLLTVTRSRLQLTPSASREEIEGLCRTCHSVSLRSSNVIIGHGDLMALPAVAAGANALGTGWDLRQRMWATDAFRTSTTGGRAARRVTHHGLLCVFTRQEAERLRARDRTLSEAVVPGALPPADMKTEWRHHAAMLGTLDDRIEEQSEPRLRLRLLRRAYRRAISRLNEVGQAVPSLRFAPDAWIDPLLTGLESYGAGENLW